VNVGVKLKRAVRIEVDGQKCWGPGAVELGKTSGSAGEGPRPGFGGRAIPSSGSIWACI
jgi:hypothetical protein